jgi:hypothetical protein
MANAKKTETIAKTNAGTTQSTNGGPIRVATAGGILTKDQIDVVLSAIAIELGSGTADHNQVRLILSAVGRKITMENLAVRAGIYKSGAKPSFFLPQ